MRALGVRFLSVFPASGGATGFGRGWFAAPGTSLAMARRGARARRCGDGRAHKPSRRHGPSASREWAHDTEAEGERPDRHAGAIAGESWERRDQTPVRHRIETRGRAALIAGLSTGWDRALVAS
jgi:hypothetical protein